MHLFFFVDKLFLCFLNYEGKKEEQVEKQVECYKCSYKNLIGVWWCPKVAALKQVNRQRKKYQETCRIYINPGVFNPVLVHVHAKLKKHKPAYGQEGYSQHGEEK